MGLLILAGTARRTAHMFKHEPDGNRRGLKAKNLWDIDLEGAGGECAVAKLLDRYWTGERIDADVGDNVQVRTSRLASASLLVYTDDPDDHYFVLVTGHAPDYMVVGWIIGQDAKRAEWFRSLKPGREPCYCVPQGALRSMKDLESCLDSRTIGS